MSELKIQRSDLVQECDLCVEGTRYVEGTKPGGSRQVTQDCDCVNGERPSEAGKVLLIFFREFGGGYW